MLETEVPSAPGACCSSFKNHKLFLPVAAIVAVLLTVSLALGAYQLGKSQTSPVTSSNPAVVPQATPPATPTPDPTAGWKTYTNEEFGFQIKYPSDWQLNGKMITSPQGDSLSLLVNNLGYGFECYQTEREETTYLDRKTATKTFMRGVKSENCDNDSQLSLFVTTQNRDNKIDLMFGYKTINKKESEKLVDQILSTFRFLP